MAFVSPIGFCRTAVKNRLADGTSGLNAQLATYCAAYGVTAWTFDFTSTSRNFFEANIGYGLTETSGNAQRNMLALYGVDFKSFSEDSNDRVMNVAFSGIVFLRADMYVGIGKQRVQNFEPYVDAATAAMMATLNDTSPSVQNVLNAQDPTTRSGKVYRMDLSGSLAQVVQDGENWVIPIRFGMSFGLVIP